MKAIRSVERVAFGVSGPLTAGRRSPFDIGCCV
jgi:hypothetical protein